MAARLSQGQEQSMIFLMHNFIKLVIQAEGAFWVSLIVCDIQENSSSQTPQRASPSAQALLPSGFNYQAKGLLQSKLVFLTRRPLFFFSFSFAALLLWGSTGTLRMREGATSSMAL